MKKNDEILRQRNKDWAQHSAEFWIELANKRESEIVHELLAISSILLPLTISIILSNIHLETFQKAGIISVWILLLVSISMGLVQIAYDSNYFQKLSRDASKRSELWSNGKKDIHDTDKEVVALGKTPPSSAMWPVFTQAATFILALILIVVLGATIISRHQLNYKNSFLKNKTTLYKMARPKY